MNTIAFFRVIKTGFVNSWRNIWLSAAATMVMVITLVILTVLMLLFVLTSYSINTTRDRVDVSVYFKPGIAETQITGIKSELEANPLIREINYTSAEDVFNNFKQRNSKDQVVSQALNALSANPFGPTLQIKAVTLDDYPQIAQELQSEKYQNAVSKVNFEDIREIINQLNRILKFIISFGIILMIVFSVIAVLVIFNTITLTIYNRREEIEIMRLVGATNWYIRGPFLVEALIYSFSAAVITGAVIVPVYLNILPKIGEYLNPGTDFFIQSFIPLPYIILLQLGVAILLSIISTFLATRKYLRI